LPAFAQRVTVFGSTRNIVATSAGVSSDSASGVRVLATELLLVRPAFLADLSQKLVFANSPKTKAGRVANLRTPRPAEADLRKQGRQSTDPPLHADLS
jgi:hypothetical protein